MPPRKKSSRSGKKTGKKGPAKKKKRGRPEKPRPGRSRTVLMVLVISFFAFAFWKFSTAPEKAEKKAAPTQKTEAAAKPAARKALKITRTEPAPATAAPLITVVIDDIGYNLEHARALRDLGDKVTYAILPQLPYSEYFGNLGNATGAEVILHLPLEALDGTEPGPGLITTGMTKEEVIATLEANLASVPHHSGVNNHMGSLGTSDFRLMRIIFSEMDRRNLLFLDSRTSQSSVAFAVGNEFGVPVVRRDIFLDNIDTKEAIRKQVRELATEARVQGYAIGIGHYRATTLGVLAEEIPRLEKEGFRFVTLKKMFRKLVE